MTTHNITGAGHLPDGSTVPSGKWVIGVPSGVLIDGTNYRTGTLDVPVAVDGTSNITLPESSTGQAYSATYKSADRRVVLGPFIFALAADMSWGDVIGSVPPIPAVAGAIPMAQKGAVNGVASLDSSGRVPAAQLTLDALEYKGTWNAATNTPTLANGTGNAGDFYKVSTSGAHDFGAGSIPFTAGDSLFYDGSAWQRVSAPDVVPFGNLAKVPDLIITGAITRNGAEVVTSAAVTWPDGTTGTFTATSIGTLNTIDAYTITRIIGGVTHTYTQPTITRDSSGAATNVPAMTYV